MSRFGETFKAFFGFGLPTDTPVDIDQPVELQSGNGDLRYGSEPVGWAYPSLFGLHGTTAIDGRAITPSGRTVSYTQLYATQPWVFATVNRFITWSELVPLKVYRRNDDDSRTRLRAKDHPLAMAIERPWRRGNSSDLVASILMPLLVHGNAALEIESGANESLRFVPRDWRHLIPQMLDRYTIGGWKYVDEQFNDAHEITADQMLHVAWAAPTNAFGVSPLSALGITLSSEIAAQLYSHYNFKNMARPPSAITADAEFFGGLEPEERDAILQDFRAQITARYAGPENAGVPAVLPPGMDWTEIGHNAQEAVLIEQRKLNREEVEGAYLMPPPMVGQLDRATFSNIGIQREMAYADTLGPQAVKVANAINSQVALNLLGEEDVYVEVDLAGVLRGNPEAQTDNFAKLWQNGVITRNEWRAKLNLDRIPPEVDPTADQYFVQGNNMIPAAQLDEVATENTTAQSQ